MAADENSLADGPTIPLVGWYKSISPDEGCRGICAIGVARRSHRDGRASPPSASARTHIGSCDASLSKSRSVHLAATADLSSCSQAGSWWLVAQSWLWGRVDGRVVWLGRPQSSTCLVGVGDLRWHASFFAWSLT
jgi:hypothetical protein